MFTAYACGNFKFADCTTLEQTVQAGFGTFFLVVWFVAIGYLGYAGLLFIMSSGDKNKAIEAKTAVTNALIGISIVLGINVLTSIVKGFFGGGNVQISQPTIQGPEIRL